ncbi:MAG: hypothetical protein ACJ8DZ_08430 [Allosphingosinicella sp.]
MDVPAPASPGRPFYLAALPAFLFRTDPAPARYVVKAWALALLPSLALSGLVGLLLPEAGRPDFNPQVTGPATLAFLLVIVSPAIETLILAPLVLVLNRWLGAGPAVVVAALLWAGAHSFAAAAWGLIVWWPFLIMSIAFLTWRSEGLGKALLLVFAIHALQNAVGAGMLLLIGP